MSLTAEQQTEYEELWAKVIEPTGKRKGLAKKDANPTDKARLRELIGKKNE
jgi:hypothetical protein